jgi:hypothetical protein
MRPQFSDGRSSCLPLDTVSQSFIRRHYLSPEFLRKLWQMECATRIHAKSSTCFPASVDLNSDPPALDDLCRLESIQLNKCIPTTILAQKRRYRSRPMRRFIYDLYEKVDEADSDYRYRDWLIRLSREMDFNDVLDSLPHNYGFYDRWRLSYPSPPDEVNLERSTVISVCRSLVVFGHPSGRPFTSPGDFARHIMWLFRMADVRDMLACDCSLCMHAFARPIYKTGEIVWLKLLSNHLPTPYADILVSSGIDAWPVEILGYSNRRYRVSLIQFPFESISLMNNPSENSIDVPIWHQPDLVPFSAYSIPHISMNQSQPQRLSGLSIDYWLQHLRDRLRTSVKYCSRRMQMVAEITSDLVVVGLDCFEVGDFALLLGEPKYNYPLLHIQELAATTMREILFKGDVYSYNELRGAFEFEEAEVRVTPEQIQCRYHPCTYLPQNYDIDEIEFIARSRMPDILLDYLRPRNRQSSKYSMAPYAHVCLGLLEMRNALDRYRTESIDNIPQLLTDDSSLSGNSGTINNEFDDETSPLSTESAGHRRSKLSELDHLLVNQSHYRDFSELPGGGTRRSMCSSVIVLSDSSDEAEIVEESREESPFNPPRNKRRPVWNRPSRRLRVPADLK